jgi:hypothetical protein
MPVIQDELWKNPGHPGMIVVTANASILEDGRLFMEYGEAMEATRRIPGIALQCANEVSTYAVDGVYGFLPVRPSRPLEKKIGFGILQTRREWNECPDLELIQYSLECLCEYSNANKSLKIRMNYPGISSGCLSAEEVAPLLLRLPSSVTVCGPVEPASLSPFGLSGAKELFLLVERWLQEGRFNYAVEFLVENGYEYPDALEQVSAVQRQLRGQADRPVENRQVRLDYAV